jgi:hypothetical protein
MKEAIMEFFKDEKKFPWPPMIWYNCIIIVWIHTIFGMNFIIKRLEKLFIFN